MLKKKKQTSVVCTILLVMVLFLLNGCGDSILEGVSDDGTFEALLEDAMIALDEADYFKAVGILEALNDSHPENKQVIQYFSNAYAGLGGLNTFAFLETIEDLNKQGRSGSIDMIGRVLGEADGRLSEKQVAEKLGYMDQSIGLMDEIVGGQGSATIQTLQLHEDDLTVQRGLLGISRIVLLIADMIIDQLGIQEVFMTEDGIKVMYANEEPDFDGIYNTMIAEKLDEDIAAIDDAIFAIKGLSGSDNDLYKDFELFMNELDQDEDRRISRVELESYLQAIINA